MFKRAALFVLVFLLLTWAASAESKPPLERLIAAQEALKRRVVKEDWLRLKGNDAGMFWFHYEMTKLDANFLPAFMATYPKGSVECVCLARDSSQSFTWMMDNFWPASAELYKGGPGDVQLADALSSEILAEQCCWMLTYLLTDDQLWASNLNPSDVHKAADRCRERATKIKGEAGG